MSRDISQILKKHRKNRILKENEFGSGLIFVLQEKISEYLEETKQNIENEIKVLKEQKILIDKIKKGDAGYTPIKGLDYFDGKDADERNIITSVLSRIPTPKDGKDGKDGENGKEGSPDTPDQIASKLNTLEEQVEIKVIKGLKHYFDNINKKIQNIKSAQSSKGGGTGNVIHKTFSVDSSTTTSSLDSKVAAGGNAIWVYYQGQFLVKGTHYTISDSTITWLETFNNDTFVDVTYIRT